LRTDAVSVPTALSALRGTTRPHGSRSTADAPQARSSTDKRDPLPSCLASLGRPVLYLYRLRLVSLLARPCRGRRSRQNRAKQHCWQRLLSRIAARRAIAVEGSGTRGTSVCATDHDRPAGLPGPQCAAETGGKTTWSSWLTENVSRPGHPSISRQLQRGRPGGPNPSDWTSLVDSQEHPSHDCVPGPLSRLHLST
jgi:hypothetical protein